MFIVKLLSIYEVLDVVNFLILLVIKFLIVCREGIVILVGNVMVMVIFMKLMNVWIVMLKKVLVNGVKWKVWFVI